MKVSNAGLDIIKKHEGFEPNMYLDPVGLPTIGYGIYLNTPELLSRYENATISEEEATALLLDHVQKQVEPVIKDSITAKINQNQFNALASFIYNVGSGNFRSSTLRRKINEGAEEEEIRYQFSRWNKANGQELSGLTKRRKEEANLYFAPPLKKKLFLVR